MHPSTAISLATPAVESAAEGYVSVYCEPAVEDGGWRLAWRSEDGSELAAAIVTVSGEVHVEGVS